MKTILFLVLLCTAVSQAAPGAAEGSLAFPETVVTIEGPQGLKSSAGVTKNSAKAGDVVRYQGAISRSEVSPSGKHGALGGISWRHLTRTEAGDVYLIVLARPDGAREATSLLFEGHADVSWRRGNWTITLTREQPNQPAEPAIPSRD